MTELVQLTEAQRALAKVETPADAKVLYDQLEALSQYARRYLDDHAAMNEIAEAKLRTARKGGDILASSPMFGRDKDVSRDGTRLPAGLTRNQSSRWQALAAIPDAEFEEHLQAVKDSDEELTLAGALRFQKLGVHFSSDTGEWSTPQDLYDELDAEFHFTLDVCATAENAKCAAFYTAADNGLAQEWRGVCWMNPPYGTEIPNWVQKAYESSLLGTAVVCLVPGRIDTAWFWDYCLKGEVRLLRGRLKFGDGANSAPFPSIVVVFPATPRIYGWER